MPFTIMDAISDQKIVKVSGDNGSGKTTLLESIYYGLYGTLNNVKPSDGGSTEVLIEMPYGDTSITIKRRTKNDITIWVNEEKYEGDRAQSMINSWFGDADAFLLTSYLRAETMHEFITATPSEKREITHLLFPDSRKYQDYVGTLKDLRRAEDLELDKREKQKIAVTSALETLVTSHPWLKEDVDLTIEDIRETVDDVRSRIDECYPIKSKYESIDVHTSVQIDLPMLEGRVEEIKSLISPISHSDLQSKIRESSAVLSRYKVLNRHQKPNGEIQPLKDRLVDIDLDVADKKSLLKEIDVPSTQSQIRESYSILGRYDALMMEEKMIEMKELDPNVSDQISSLREEILNSKIEEGSKESKLSYLRGSLQSLMDGYDSDCIRDHDLTRKLHLLCPSYESAKKKRSELENDISDKEYLISEYKMSLEIIEYNKRLEDILQCPSCGTSLRHTDGLCVVEDMEPKPVIYTITKDDLFSLSMEVESMKKSLSDISSKIQEYEKIVTSNPHLPDLLQKYGSPAQYNRFITEMRNRKDRISQVETDIALIETDTSTYRTRSEMESMKDQLDGLESMVQSHKSASMRLDHIRYQILELISNYPWIGTDHISLLEEKVSLASSLQIALDKLDREKESIKNQIKDLERYEMEENEISTMLTSHPWLDRGDEYIRDLEVRASDAVSIQMENERLEVEMKDILHQIEKYKNEMSRLEHAQHQKSEMEELYPWLLSSDHITSLNLLIDKINDNNRKKGLLKIYEQYNSIKEKDVKLDAVIKKHEEKVDRIVRLDSLVNEAYRVYINKKMKSIEYDISILGKLFFDESMNISIVQDGKDKPAFDLKVEYEGKTIDKIKTMSTGQRKIITIILMIVLTKYMDGKIMMLDEAFSSIHMDTRGVILAELEKLNIPIIFTSHDPISGGYFFELSL